VTRTRPR